MFCIVEVAERERVEWCQVLVVERGREREKKQSKIDENSGKQGLKKGEKARGQGGNGRLGGGGLGSLTFLHRRRRQLLQHCCCCCWPRHPHRHPLPHSRQLP